MPTTSTAEPNSVTDDLNSNCLIHGGGLDMVKLENPDAFDLLLWIGHCESRKSGRVEIHKTWWQTALVWCHPVVSAAGNDCSLVSIFFRASSSDMNQLVLRHSSRGNPPLFSGVWK